jgi:hypothetical protein
MEKVPTTSADVLVYQAGSFRDTLGPLLIGAAGLLLLAIALGIPRNHLAVVGLLGLVGGVGAIIGLVTCLRSLGQSGIILDRADGTVTTWRRFLVPLSSRTRDLAAFSAVLLSMARVQKRYASGIVYLAGLQADNGEPLPLYWHEEYRTARRFAEELATFLDLPFTDAASTDTLVQNFGQPRQPLLELQPIAGLGLRAAQPSEMRCRVSWQDGTLVIEEPPLRWKEVVGRPLLLFLLLSLPLLAFGAYAHFFLSSSAVGVSPLVGSAVVVAMLFLIFLAAVLASLPQLAGRRMIQADRESLRFVTKGRFATRDTSIRTDDISELRIGFGHLTAITPRDCRLVCGRLDNPLTQVELEWLREQLTRALRGPVDVL